MTEGDTPAPSYVADYLKQIKEKAGGKDCIYRGEPDTDPPLASGAERRIQQSLPPMQWVGRDIKNQVLNEIMLEYHNKLLDDARQKGFGLVDGRVLSDLELLTELQHLGAATCLLDFTKSALVALYFACSAKPPEGDGKKTDDGKLFIVPYRNIGRALKDTSIDRLLAEKSLPLLWRPAIHGAAERRILAQHGIFLVHANKDCESISIKPDDKGNVLEELRTDYQISADSLFPDLNGFAQHQSVTAVINNERIYLYRGLAKFILGQFQEAIMDYDEAIRIKPDFAEAFHGRGIAKAMLGQHQDAIVDHNEAIRIKPDHAGAFHGRGFTKAMMGQHQDAIVDYDKAIHIKPDYVEAFQYRGLAKCALGQHQEAIKDYDQAIRIKPDYASAFHARGLVKATLGQHQEAIVDHNEAIRIKPDYANAFYERGICWHTLGDKDKARADFQRALKLAEQEGNTELRDMARSKLDELDKSS